MPDTKTVIEEFEVKDLEDGSKLKVAAIACSELGNNSKPGVQIHYMGYIVNFEPLICERLAYQAKKAGGGPLLLESNSWMVHQDQFIKVYFIPGAPAKARVEVKSRTTDAPVVKDYVLPFDMP